MIKKIFSALVVVLFATSMMAQSGLTCEDAIPVDNAYEGTVDGPCELWYTANTYDLPLHVYFIPESDNSTLGPEVQIDFTCTSGVYDDPKLDSLVHMVEDFSISFPIELWTESSTLNGKNVWDLEVNKSYREQLADFGITYPVQAFVKVTFFEAGVITLSPDTAFSTCMENAYYVNLGDTIAISANDTERTFVFPYTEWQEDSIRFVWTGAETAEVFVAVQKCDFTPVANNPYVWNTFSVAQNTPHKLYSEDMKSAIKEQKEGGLYYAKIVAPSAGKLVVEKIPMSAIEGDAQVLEYGQTLPISSQSEQLYCFPKTWGGTEFTAPTTGDVKLFVATVPDFSASENDANVLKVYQLDKINGQRVLQLSGKEMGILTSRATGDYIYVRMVSEKSTMLTINEWLVSSCADKSSLMRANKEQSVASKSYSTIYRLRYDEFSGYPITITWSGNSTLPVFLAEDCNLDLSTEADNLLLNPAPSIARRGSLTVDAETVNSWASRIDEDGFMYVCFNPNNNGRVTFKTDKPEEEDPVIPLDPVYSTIDATLCYGEVYEWNGQTYTATGEYTQTLVAANGADSIVTLKLTIRPEVAAVEEKDTICYGESYTWQGTTYTDSGEYSTTLQDENGCDYQAVLNLTVLPEVAAVEEKDTICYGESYTWQGTTYTESGEYSTTLQDENGCDYQAVLSLTVLPEIAGTTETAEVPFGETYTWHGTTYAESGSYTITLQDANGCDYQATLHLTVLPEPEKTDLLPNDALSVSLPTALNVYAMDYAAWKAQDVKWQWTGSTPLYVFVAKSSDYALTPQNRHVLLFAPIEPGEEIVLTKEQVSAWESLAEGGMIYVRLLTEKSGQLTTVAE